MDLSKLNYTQDAILYAFVLGMGAGEYQAKNNIEHQSQLEEQCPEEFQERNRLIEKFANTGIENGFLDFGWIFLRIDSVIGFELIKDYNGKGEAVRAHINGSSANLVTQNPEAIARVKKLIGK